jgi:hypothetical protein
MLTVVPSSMEGVDAWLRANGFEPFGYAVHWDNARVGVDTESSTLILDAQRLCALCQDVGIVVGFEGRDSDEDWVNQYGLPAVEIEAVYYPGSEQSILGLLNVTDAVLAGARAGTPLVWQVDPRINDLLDC